MAAKLNDAHTSVCGSILYTQHNPQLAVLCM